MELPRSPAPVQKPKTPIHIAADAFLALKAKHSTRADLLRRMGRRKAAIEAYARSLKLVTNQGEHRYLDRRLREVRSMRA